jgi:5-oxoprolinase (ATP-hydrolysing)
LHVQEVAHDNFAILHLYQNHIEAARREVDVARAIFNEDDTVLEVLELRYSVRADSRAISHHTDGKSKWHGGDGADRRGCFLETMTADVLANYRKNRPHGYESRYPKPSARNWVELADGSREELGHICEVKMNRDYVFVIQTPGGW